MKDFLLKLMFKMGNKVMAFTYNEPTIFFEYALDTARLAKERGIKVIFKSNGYESALAVEKMTGLVDAVNVDLKSFRDDFYKSLCKARLQPVLDTIRRLKEVGIWVEVTTLVIPGENDSDDELNGIAQFLASLDQNIPWHVTPFHPDYQVCSRSLEMVKYQMTEKPRTSEATLTRAGNIGRKAGLHFVYNRGGGTDTLCTGCNTCLIRRAGFSAEVDSSIFKAGECLKYTFTVKFSYSNKVPYKNSWCVGMSGFVGIAGIRI